MNKKKMYLITIIFIFSTVVYFVFMLYGCMEKQYEEEEYYNNYYEYNSGSLDKLKDFLVENINGRDFVWMNLEEYNKLLKEHSKGTLFLTDRDIICNKEYCFTDRFSINEKILEFGIIFFMYWNNNITVDVGKLYGSFDNYIFYQEGYYKGKQEGESIDGNDMHAIEKIFDNDWGVINGCYGCGGGGWD